MNFATESEVTVEAPTQLRGAKSRLVKLKLDPAPARGSGLNTWMFKIACCLARHRVLESEAIKFIAERAGGDAKPGEVERQVAEGYRRAFENSSGRGIDGAPKASTPRRPKWPGRDDEMIRKVVTECPASLSDVWDASPLRPDERRHPLDILADLHGARGDEFLCLAPESTFGFETRTFNEWAQFVRENRTVGGSGRCVRDCEMVVPNLMRTPSGKTLDGKENRPRTRDNACDPDQMSFAVVEVDIREDDPLCQSLGRHPHEIGASIVLSQLDLSKVRIVVMSGGKSIHAWMDVAGMNSDAIADYFRSLCPLAVDWHGSYPEHQFRLPGGWRVEKEAPQSVIFWNPRGEAAMGHSFSVEEDAHSASGFYSDGMAVQKQRVEPLKVIPLISLRSIRPDPEDTLLGNRHLCREGSMLFIGPSGVGKSSSATQQDVCWSVGKPAFGIKPARPLKILQIQAENDRGDLHEMINGIWDAMGFGPEEEKLCAQNLLTASEKTRTGELFLSEVVRPLLEAHHPDIVRIDPLLAYLGDDPTDTKALAAFCRSGLNPLLEEFRCAVILNHHTPKTTNRDTTTWRASDWMYSGAGGADLSNWARAILVIEPTDNPAVFRFIGAKRGIRLGWCDQNGQRQLQRIFCHSAGTIAWREATEAEYDGIRAKKDKGQPTESELMEHVPQQGGIDKDALLELWNQMGVGQTKCKGLIAKLLAGGKVFEWRVKRSRTRDKLQISRHQQEVS